MGDVLICGVYKITSPTNKVYIGESGDIKRRQQEYSSLHCKSQTKLYNSLKKYGWESHTFEILENCDFDELKCRERFWQDHYDVLNGGLNLKLTKCGEKKMVHSEETIQKIKDNRPDISGENNPCFGRVWSQEERENHSKIFKGMLAGDKNPMYGKRGEEHPAYGYVYTEEQLERRSEGRKGEKNAMYGIRRGSHHGAKKVLDTATGIVYDCLKDAAEALGLKYTTLSQYLNGRLPNKTTLTFLID